MHQDVADRGRLRRLLLGLLGSLGSLSVPVPPGRIRRLAQVTESRHAAVAERLEDWGDDDITRFAELLIRYNVGPPDVR
ncbi:hypothetical protein [Catenulispora rubra]|uniref:hypothetical protein n=1 Tax=Catenulispora rubra TaxID=280293 RepID=UPI0018926252|nr:hypothetical protein [Catenulispora rubra]